MSKCIKNSLFFFFEPYFEALLLSKIIRNKISFSVKSFDVVDLRCKTDYDKRCGKFTEGNVNGGGDENMLNHTSNL